MSNTEIRVQVVSVNAAAYWTTSGAMACAIYALLSTPGVLDTTADEVQGTPGGHVSGADDLKALTHLNDVVHHEVLRLYPPGVVSARK